MTTIAIDHDTIAADGRISWSGIIAQDDAVKVYKDGDIIVATMGGEAAANQLTNFVLGRCQEIPEDCDGNVLTINDDGEILHHSVKDGAHTADSVNTPYAFGSGQHFALAALDLGKTAKESVKYAMTRDPNTGGKIKAIKYK